jgi:hypothetical protein
VGGGKRFCYQEFGHGVGRGCGEIVMPVYVEEAHAGGLGWELFAEV